MRTTVALIALLAVSATAQAQEAFEPSLSLTLGGMSYHFDRSKGYNEHNTGLGLEYRFREDVSVTVGQYRNSVRNDTHYAAINYQPLSVGPVRIGASIGVMDGYPNMRNGGAFFAALPMLTYETKHFGVNFGVIPDVPKKGIDGAFILQLKYKLF